MNFNLYVFQCVLIGILSMTSVNALAAEERQISIHEFNELSISEGLDATVQCGTEPSIVAKGKGSVLDDIEINETDGRLEVSIWKADLGLLSRKNAELIITTNSPLKFIEAIKGSQLDIQGCALSKDIVRVSAGMGAVLSIEGRTNHMDLELAMGSSFNKGTSELFVTTVNIEATMGVDAYLCTADYVEGEQTLGAAIHIGKETKSNIKSGFGSEVTHRNCN